MARVPETASQDEWADDGAAEGEGEFAVTLDSSVVDAIGNALLAHYRDLTDAPLPDRFLAMLAELEAKERDHGK